MTAPRTEPEEIDDPALARLLSMCRTEEERQRAKTQWYARQAALQAEREAEMRKERARRDAAMLDSRRRAEEAFRHIVRDNYPFTDESFEVDWPSLRARLVAEIIYSGVINDWVRYQREGEAGSR
jgi:hypothetical protein